MNNESILNLQNNALIKRYDEFLNAEKRKFDIRKRDKIISTGLVEFDDAGFLNKNEATFLISQEDNYAIKNIADNIMLETIANGNRVLVLSTDPAEQINEFKITAKHKGIHNVEKWFDKKPLYIANYNEKNSIIDNLQAIDFDISNYVINVLYIPYLEQYLMKYDNATQIEIIIYLNKLVARKGISILTTVQSYSCDEEDERIRLFETEQKFQPYAIKRLINIPTIFELKTIDDEMVELNYFDNFDMCKKKISIKSDNHFYTYNSIKIDYTK